MPVVAATRKAEKLARYKEVRDRGARWLLDRMNPDGSLGDPDEGFHYYRAPWTFTQVGATDAATAICGYVRRTLQTPDGAFAGPGRKLLDAYAYRNATFIVGAHRARQYDLSLGAIPALIDWQDPASGAVPDDLLPSGERSDNMDIPYACGAGFAFLDTGYLDRARMVAGFLRRIYDAQTELPTRFFYAWSKADQRVIREYPEERRFWYLVDNQAPLMQRWTIGGIAAGFLCRLFMADPNPAYLALARDYQAFSMAGTDRQFDYAQVCKSSWGSALLYQLTGEEQYEDWTYRMGDWYATTQRGDGRWQWPANVTLGQQIELTLEFVMHVDTIIGGLASRP